MEVYLISGKAEHGKDYTANMMKNIAEQNGKRCLIIHYADLVKHICKCYFNWDGLKDAPGRSLLQRVGTDMRIEKDPTIWSDMTCRIISFLASQYDYVIIPDWRFILQYEITSSHFDVQTIRVIRYGDQTKTSMYQNRLTEQQRNHISETQLDHFDFDYIIDNWGNTWYNNNEEKKKILKEIML